MTFSKALEEIKKGTKAMRAGWNGRNMHVCLHRNNDDSIITEPYLVMKNPVGDHVIWTASQTDILSEDWMVII